MEIILKNIGRRFNREWIFKNLNYTFQSGKSYAVLGINGSGKSTLLQILAGSLSPSTGKILFKTFEKELDVEDVYKHLSISAPYLELIEELTLAEVLQFHFNFKKRLNNIPDDELIEVLNMQSSKNKQIKYFSSGMKQRVKLVLAVFSDTKIVLLDEPCSNLDEQGISWYQNLIDSYKTNRLVIVCSNQLAEYDFCDEQLLINEYKI